MSKNIIRDFLYPNSVAIYGANNKGTGIGSIQLMNLLRFGYKGKLYPIHLKLESIFGLKAYKAISELPEVPDLVIVALPAKIVPQIFEECGKKGVKRIILISGGFRETEGEDPTNEINEICEKYGIRFIGPNCLGVYNNWIYPEEEDRAFNTNIWVKIKRGNFSIVSQSGTLSSHIWFDPDNLDLGLSKSLSVGNEANIDVVDVLEYLKDDDETKVIGIYVEEIKRGREFLKLAKQITPKKPIIAIYPGGSKASMRAVKSHTGSLAGNSKIYDAAFKEAGVIKTELVEEFLDLGRILSRGIIPKGNRLGILTNSGGPAIMIANLAEKQGLEIPLLSEKLQDKIREYVIPTASVKNPVDCTFDLNLPNYYVTIPKLLLESGEIDLLVIYGVFGLQEVMLNYMKDERIAKNMQINPGPSGSDKPLEKLLVNPITAISRQSSIPVVYINPQNYSSEWSKKLRDAGALLFKLWDRPIRCLGKLIHYASFINGNTVNSNP